MCTTFSTFCNHAIVDAVIQPSEASEKGCMYLAISTDAGDYVAIHFKDETNFHAFCAKHNFPVEDTRNAN